MAGFSRTLAAVALCMVCSAVAAGATGDEAVKRFDDTANTAKDTWFLFEATTVEAGKAPRVMSFTVLNKGEHRLVDFKAPGDMKGTRVLVISRQLMYVYVPAYNKVRRVGSHVTEQGFMGTTYSDEDMSTTRFGAVYSAVQTGEGEGYVTVSLTPKPGAKTAYGKLEMDLSTKLGLPSAIRFFNADLQHIKTELRGAYDCGGGACTPGEMSMTDHRRGDAVTTLKVLDRKVNTGISDSAFSVRNLERGR